MPNFLTWGMENDKFGAYVQLNASTFKPQPDGRVLVEKTPRTEFFDREKVDRLAETATKTKPFWEQMKEMLPKQEALFSNSRDISTDAQPKVASADPALSLTNKPVFSA